MLKLERVSHDSQIAIFVRDKQHLFTKAFLTALSTALLMHALIFLLFQISPIKIRWSSTVVSPAIVEADLRIASDAIVTAYADSAFRPRSSLLEPKPPLPAIQNVPLFSTVRQMEFFKVNSISANPFAQIEKEVYQPLFSTLRKETKLVESLALVISGPLSNWQLVNNGIDEVHLLAVPHSTKKDRQLRAVYSVLVKGDNGQIFWYEKREKVSLAFLEKSAEQILKNMRFAPDMNTAMVSGEIEFHFSSEQYD